MGPINESTKYSLKVVMMEKFTTMIQGTMHMSLEAQVQTMNEIIAEHVGTPMEDAVKSDLRRAKEFIALLQTQNEEELQKTTPEDFLAFYLWFRETAKKYKLETHAHSTISEHTDGVREQTQEVLRPEGSIS